MTATLVLGNKALSSWSLRAWLVCRAAPFDFVEEVVPLDRPDTRKRLAAITPAGLVPVLKDGEVTVWDSLGIAEYVAERHPEAKLWPEDRVARAHARSITAEMHSGFSTLRTVWPFDGLTEAAGVMVPPGVRKDLDRLATIWTETRERFGETGAAGQGPYLFGGFTIPDAFFAPVAVRIRTFGPVELPATAQAYIDALLGHPAMTEWLEGARAEQAAGWYEKG